MQISQTQSYKFAEKIFVGVKQQPIKWGWNLQLNSEVYNWKLAPCITTANDWSGKRTPEWTGLHPNDIKGLASQRLHRSALDTSLCLIFTSI